MKHVLRWTSVGILVLLCAASCPLDPDFLPEQFAVVLVAAPEAGGSVSMSPMQDTYEAGASVTIEATAEAGYEFVHWEGDALPDTNPQVVTVDRDLVIIAYFAAIADFTLDVSTVPGGAGSVTAEPDWPSYPDGTSVALSAAAAANYVFAGWGGDLSGVTNPATIIMDDDKSVTASFTAIPAYVLNTDASPAAGGAVAREPDQSSYLEGSIVELSATAAPNYTFGGWAGDLTGSENPVSVTMDASKSITAVFNAIPTYDLYVAANPFGYGTVTRNPDAPSYLTGTVVELTASPNENYTFTGWSGDLTGTTNPQSITMDGDRTVQANFELACSPNLYEPNQTLAAAWALPTVAEFDSPAAYSARIVPAGDFDFYRVYFEEGSHTCFPFTSQDFTIEVELSPPTGLDYDLYLYADDGTLLDSSMNGGSTSEYIRYDYNGTCTIDDSIYLYIEVRPWSGYWGCGEYTLTLDMSSQ